MTWGPKRRKRRCELNAQVAKINEEFTSESCFPSSQVCYSQPFPSNYGLVALLDAKRAMTTFAPASASLATHKKRQRREAKIREQYDRISAALLNTDSTKFAARNPTRVVPAVPGFETLSKAEIKKDCKEIEKANSSMMNREHYADKEEDLMQGIERSFHPSCHPESTLLKKFNRLTQWTKNPEQKDKDIALWSAKVAAVRQSRYQLEKESGDWLNYFDVSRKVLMDAIAEVDVDNHQLKAQFAQLQVLCAKACGGGQEQVTAKEIIEEIERREVELEKRMESMSLQSANRISLSKSSLPDHLQEQLFPADSAPEEERKAAAVKRLSMLMGGLEDALRQLESGGDQHDLDKEADMLAMLSVAKGIKVEKVEDGAIDKDELAKAFISTTAEEVWASYLTTQLDPSNGVRKKRRTTEPVRMLTNARSRVERGPRLLFSPLSLLEDRYLAAEVTAASADPVESLVSLLPAAVAHDEDVFMDTCMHLSETAAMSTEVANMQNEVAELNRILQEAHQARHKFDALHRQAISEDEAERARIRQELIYYGLAAVEEQPTEPTSAATTASSSAPAEAPKKGGNRRSRGANGAANGNGTQTSSSVATMSSTATVADDTSSEPALSQASQRSVSSTVPVEKESTGPTVTKRKPAGQPEPALIVTGKRKR